MRQQHARFTNFARPGSHLSWLFALPVLLFLSVSAQANILALSVSGSGQVAGANNFCTAAAEPSCSIDYGAQTVLVTLTATPDNGFQFNGWGGDCASFGTSPTCQVSVQGSAGVPVLTQNVSASFSAPPIVPPTFPSATLTVSTSGSGSGVVSSGQPNQGINCPGDCSQDFIVGTQVSLSATADTASGSVFIGWTGANCSGTDSCIVEMGSDQSVEAIFEADSDGDGVFDPADKCPNTPAGEMVDSNGCGASQLDDDNDGVSNDLDQCPDTPAGENVNAEGCSSSQLDSDGDGVSDTIDECPNTAPGATVDAQGCSVTQRFGRDLGSLAGLNANERLLAQRIDDVCPRLLEPGLSGSLTKGQKDLRNACVRLKTQGTTDGQAVTALREISLRELASQTNYAVDIANAHTRRLGGRMEQLNAGGGRGISLSGLNIGTGEDTIPSSVLQSAFEGLLGMAAGGDNDFGKLGLFIQGDYDFGDRDETNLESGYDFDAWNFSIGADYRFTDTLFGGISIGLGDVDVDYSANGGSSDISNWTVSTYGGWQINSNWYLDGLLNYSAAEFESSRRVNYTDIGGGFAATHRGDTDGDQIFIGLNTGYMMNKGSWRFGPTASLTYIDGSIDGFSERAQGGDSEAWNFAVDKRDYESLRLSLGAQVDYVVNTSFGVIIPGVRASWVSENEDGGERIGLRLVNNPFAESELNSQQISMTTDGRDSSFADISFNVSGQFIMGFSGFFSYQLYSAYDNYSQQGVTLGMRWDRPF